MLLSLSRWFQMFQCFYPRALFTVSGELLPRTDKSKLMAVLGDLPNKIIVDLQTEDDSLDNKEGNCN